MVLNNLFANSQSNSGTWIFLASVKSVKHFKYLLVIRGFETNSIIGKYDVMKLFVCRLPIIRNLISFYDFSFDFNYRWNVRFRKLQ